MALLKSQEPNAFYVDSVLLWHAKSHHGVEGGTFLGYVRRSVKASHPKGNRRFYEWFFTVNENNAVVSYCMGENGAVISAEALREAKRQGEDLYTPQYRCGHCHDSGQIQVFNECAWCEGRGCDKCNQEGGTYAMIACTACPPKDTWASYIHKLVKAIK